MASSSSNGNTMPKSNPHRKRKIEIKKVEQPTKRHVTFTKRKLGLFNKVTELSILCEVDTALIITSSNGKHYTCGFPNPDTVVQRYLGAPKQRDVLSEKNQHELIEKLRLEYEEVHNQLNEERKRFLEISEAKETSPNFPSWWNNSVEEMDLEGLENFKVSLENLKLNLVGVMENKKLDDGKSTPFAVVPPPPQPFVVVPPPQPFVPPPQLEENYITPMPLATFHPPPELANLPYIGDYCEGLEDHDDWNDIEVAQQEIERMRHQHVGELERVLFSNSFHATIQEFMARLSVLEEQPTSSRQTRPHGQHPQHYNPSLDEEPMPDAPIDDPPADDPPADPPSD